MNTRLLATKFHIPPWRTGGVVRARLLEQLTAGLRQQRKMAVVSAPAGYGKTTLVSSWIYDLQSDAANQEKIVNRVAWLSLDEADNDPSRF